MEKNFLSMELIYSTKGVQFDKLNNNTLQIHQFQFNQETNLSPIISRSKRRPETISQDARNGKKGEIVRGSSRTRSSDRASATRFLHVARAKFTLQDIGKERAE